MKNLKISLLALIGLNFFVLTSCDDDPDPQPQPQSIVEIAQNTDNLSTLVAALQEADLVSAVQAEGITVFAPTNEAFQDLLDSDPTWNSLSDIDDALLEHVLKFHVLGGEVRASQLSNSYVTTLSDGPNDEQVVLQVDIDGGVSFNGGAEPITTDIEASNGVVHTIDKVMLPPNVVSLALNNPNFSTLVAALTRSDLSTDFVSILNQDGPYTVFAPTNDAFARLLQNNPDWDTLDDIPAQQLEGVLAYHVVSGQNVQADQLRDGQTIDAIGGEFTIDLSGVPTINAGSNTAQINLTDVQGTNGVIHVISEVILP